MRLSKILNATFEDSLNLEDDSFIRRMESDGNEKAPIKKRPILITIIFLILIGFLYIITLLTSKGFRGEMGYSTLERPQINFLPMWLFYLLLLVWLILILIMKKENGLFIGTFKGIFHANNYMIWLILEINLFFLTFFFIPLTVFGVIAFFGLVILIGYAVGRSKLRSLSKLLFNLEEENTRIDNFIQKIFKAMMKYGWLLLVGITLWKFIFPGITGVRTDIVGFIGIVAMWFVMDIAIIVAEMYLFLPYLLYGYYKYKYPEEYREWEGKTQIEWYGEKYFNKHIKGTDKEEKIND
jgi:hypothetical protein